jgi:hypothetical protein
MSTSPCGTAVGTFRATRSVWQRGGEGNWWSERREATLNWLALGILLAAWNASYDDASEAGRRPEALRRYTCVTVRAATTCAAERRATATNR